MYLRPPFPDDQSDIIRLARIFHYSYYFIRSLAIRIRRIQLFLFQPDFEKHQNQAFIAWLRSIPTEFTLVESARNFYMLYRLQG